MVINWLEGVLLVAVPLAYLLCRRIVTYSNECIRHSHAELVNSFIIKERVLTREVERLPAKYRTWSDKQPTKMGYYWMFAGDLNDPPKPKIVFLRGDGETHIEGYWMPVFEPSTNYRECLFDNSAKAERITDDIATLEDHKV